MRKPSFMICLGSMIRGGCCDESGAKDMADEGQDYVFDAE